MEQTDTTTPPPALLVPPKEARRLLGIGQTTLYELIGAKRLEVIKIGKATRITMDSIRALASGKAA